MLYGEAIGDSMLLTPGNITGMNSEKCSLLHVLDMVRLLS